MQHDEETVRDIDQLSSRVLGERYRLDEFIAKGGFGAVYRGTDLRLKQTVAIKIGLVGLTLRDFMKEAQLAVKVRHNNIVQVTDFGSDTGMAYLVMEFLRGQTLEQLFKQQKRQLTDEQLRQFLVEAGDALTCIHADGLVHRDLKPQNIFVQEPHAESGWLPSRPKFVLLDFGIAAKLDAEGTLRNRSQDNSGTIEYMAPELLSKNPEPTPQSDIYAFGVILYKMVTGSVPFPRDDDSQIALAACLHAISKKSAPQFKYIAPDRIIAKEIETLIGECLEKKPESRPKTVSEVCGRFITILDQQAATRKSAGEAHEKASQSPVVQNRNRIWYLSAIVIVGLVAWQWVPMPARQDSLDVTKRDQTTPAWNRPRVECLAVPDLIVGRSGLLKVTCPDLPPGATLDVTADEAALSSARLKVTSLPPGPDAKDHVLQLDAARDAAPRERTIVVTATVKFQNHVDVQRLPVDVRIVWLPPECEPVQPTEVVRAHDEFYFKRIRRVIGQTSIEFLLVAQPNGFGDPSSFYIMRDKVSRELFEQLLLKQRDAISAARVEEIRAVWDEIDRDQTGKKRSDGTAADHPRWPATGTTAEEASVLAMAIGGHLPTLAEWKRASGFDFFSPPAGSQPPDDWDRRIWIQGPFQGTWNENDSAGIALKGYVDAGQSQRDVSYYGCRDMAGNGAEFLSDSSSGTRLPLPSETDQAQRDSNTVYVLGKEIGSQRPFLFDVFLNSSNALPLASCTEPRSHTGFRIVLEKR